MDKWIRFALASLVGLLVSACGGGNGDGPRSGSDVLLASTESFDLRSAWINYTRQPKALQADISGRDNGSSIGGRAAGYSSTLFPVTFEGRRVWGQVATAEFTFVKNGEANTSIGSSILYFDNDYNFLGESGNGFSVVDSPAAFPSSVRVGNSGLLFIATNFTDASKNTVVGSTQMTYTIEPDSANSVVVALTTVVRSINGAVPVSSVARYRLTRNGALTRLSETVTDSGPLAPTLLFTYRMPDIRLARPTASTAPFNLRAALSGELRRPQTLRADVSGRVDNVRVAGLSTISISPLYPDTFEGRPAMAQSVNINLQLVGNGTPIATSENSVAYYDTANNWLGAVGETYEVANSPPVIPEFARPGDGGLLYAATEFTDASKAIVTGTEYGTYSVEGETATSAILVLNTVTVNMLGTVVDSGIARFRLTNNGTATRLSETLTSIAPAPATLTLTFQ